MIRITTIRLCFRFKVPAGLREKAERAVATFADRCPAYLSIKDCIRVTWKAEMSEGGVEALLE